ncbi:MAG: D-aminoacyl-tRNA deacylase [Candidatus Gastranaerophilales bacterium]|nr:D-aminoacyl-tRNA deacylase [Candidatus Gastranaerophilales bacterium]
MKALIQRVKNSSVEIDGKISSSIGAGMLILLGVEKNDTFKTAAALADKVLKFRIFEDENDKMNLSVCDINGEILVVSQFTLAADCKKGTRPSFDNAKMPKEANEIYEFFVNELKKSNLKIQTGVFGAMMDVKLTNDGPVTFMLEKQGQ